MKVLKEGEKKLVNLLNEAAGQWDRKCCCCSGMFKSRSMDTVLSGSKKVTIVDAREMPGKETMRLKEPQNLQLHSLPPERGNGWGRGTIYQEK